MSPMVNFTVLQTGDTGEEEDTWDKEINPHTLHLQNNYMELAFNQHTLHFQNKWNSPSNHIHFIFKTYGTLLQPTYTSVFKTYGTLLQNTYTSSSKYMELSFNPHTLHLQNIWNSPSTNIHFIFKTYGILLQNTYTSSSKYMELSFNPHTLQVQNIWNSPSTNTHFIFKNILRNSPSTHIYFIFKTYGTRLQPTYTSSLKHMELSFKSPPIHTSQLPFQASLRGISSHSYMYYQSAGDHGTLTRGPIYHLKGLETEDVFLDRTTSTESILVVISTELLYD